MIKMNVSWNTLSPKQIPAVWQGKADPDKAHNIGHESRQVLL